MAESDDGAIGHWRDADADAFRTKSEIAYGRLRRWIVAGRLPAGQRLDQAWLAAELGVSRMPLRQALLRLEADGLVRNEPHRGASVAPISVAEIKDVYAAREALEGMLAEAGTRAGDEREFAAMAASLAIQEEAVHGGDVVRFVDADRDFHFTLYRAAGYARSLEIAARLRDMADRYIWRYARYERGAARSVAEHRRILAACRGGDAAAARELTERHIRQGREVLALLATTNDGLGSGANREEPE